MERNCWTWNQEYEMGGMIVAIGLWVTETILTIDENLIDSLASDLLIIGTLLFPIFATKGYMLFFDAMLCHYCTEIAASKFTRAREIALAEGKNHQSRGEIWK